MTADSSVAIVVPSYNRPDQLSACLQSLVKVRGEGIEIVVVDDGSAEPLAPVCERFGERVRCIRQPNRGPAAARNAGVRATDAPFVAFTDDDCQPHANWIEELRAAHAGDPERLVGGRVVNRLSDDVFAAASQSLCDYLYSYFGAAAGEAPFFTSNNIACDRARFEALGGFDETFPLAAAEDRDFGLRWRANGGRMVYAAPAVVEHVHALDLKRFWRQHVNYGRGARHLEEVMRARRDAMPVRQPLGFYLRLLAHPLHDGRGRPLSRATLMFVSQLATTRGYFAERRAPSARAPSAR